LDPKIGVYLVDTCIDTGCLRINTSFQCDIIAAGNAVPEKRS